MSGPVQRRHRQSLQKGRPGLKKIALPALAIAAVVVTGGAALGLLPGITGLGGLAASLGASAPHSRGAKRRGDRRDHRRHWRLRHDWKPQGRHQGRDRRACHRRGGGRHWRSLRWRRGWRCHRQRNAAVSAGLTGAAEWRRRPALAVSCSGLPNMAGQAATGIGGAVGQAATGNVGSSIASAAPSFASPWHQPRHGVAALAAACSASSAAIRCWRLRGDEGHRRRAPVEGAARPGAQASSQQLRRHRRLPALQRRQRRRAGPREHSTRSSTETGSTNTTPQRSHPAEDGELEHGRHRQGYRCAATKAAGGRRLPQRAARSGRQGSTRGNRTRAATRPTSAPRSRRRLRRVRHQRHEADLPGRPRRAGRARPA
jgi:hypothetical protein